ncbi:MAG: hypothetical protein EOP54_14365, partial [Sphingobacteriales bacterium]
MDQLVGILTPFIWEGMNSIYKSAAQDALSTKCEDKTLLIFQKYLQKVATWNQLQIDDETTRIKTASNTTDYLDDLIKAVIKSNITLLTFANTGQTSISQSFYDSIKTSSFIHICYIECAKDAHNNPYLFYHDVSPMDLKRNQLVIHQNIEQCINKATRKMLPLKIILNEYLTNPINISKPIQSVELISNKPLEEKVVSPKKVSDKKLSNKKLSEKSLHLESLKNQNLAQNIGSNLYANNLLN